MNLDHAASPSNRRRSIVRSRGGPSGPGASQALGGLLALAGIFAGLVFLPTLTPSAASAGSHAARAVTSGGDQAAGRQIYLASCASCHGDAAQGTRLAPSLLDSGPALLDFMMRTGRMPLPELGQSDRRGPVTMTQAQIDDVVAYVGSIGTGPAIPDVAISGADLALGRSLFIANCAACHGAAGAGGGVGNGITAPDLHLSDPLTVGEAVVAGPPPMPRFAFAPPELNALAAYVQFLRNPPAPGGSAIAEVGPVPEGFVAGFVGLVLLLVFVRWIGRTSPRDRDNAVPSQAEPGQADRTNPPDR